MGWGGVRGRGRGTGGGEGERGEGKGGKSGATPGTLPWLSHVCNYLGCFDEIDEHGSTLFH